MAIFRESFALALSSSTSFFLAQKRSHEGAGDMAGWGTHREGEGEAW